jgi:hypothetical protein
MRGDTEKIKKTFPLNLHQQIQGLFCVMWLIFLRILKALQNE